MTQAPELSQPEQAAEGPSAEERALVENLRAGGAARRQAIAELYHAYQPRLRAYYLSHGAAAAQAEDWVQESFVRLLRSLDEFRGECAFAGWLWTIARNVMLDAIRRARHTSSMEDMPEGFLDRLADPAPGATARIEDGDLRDCVRQGFAAFAREHPERAQCLRWIVVDDLAIAEVARVLGRTLGATREYLSQCRKKLRAFLEPCMNLLPTE